MGVAGTVVQSHPQQIMFPLQATQLPASYVLFSSPHKERINLESNLSHPVIIKEKQRETVGLLRKLELSITQKLSNSPFAAGISQGWKAVPRSAT